MTREMPSARAVRDTLRSFSSRARRMWTTSNSVRASRSGTVAARGAGSAGGRCVAAPPAAVRTQLRRQVSGADGLAAARQGHGALELVLQLAHVAGPVEGHQQLEGLGGEPVDLLVVPLGGVFEDSLGEQRDVLAALAQRRQQDGKRRQAVVEILAKALPRDLGTEVAVRRRDDAHIDGAGRRVTDRHHLAFLQNPQ